MLDKETQRSACDSSLWKKLEDFQALTKDFIIPSMQEKLPSPRKPKRKATIMQKQDSKQDFKIETTDTDTESR
jgi:hypothetical protein